MKKFRFLFSMFMVITMALSFNACSDDDDPSKDPDPETKIDYHFDIFMTVGKHGGMNRGDGTIVKSVDALTANMEMIDIKNDGIEFRSPDNTYSMEAIVKGKYYYQVPNSNDRFTKLQVVGNSVNIIQEQKFAQNTYKVRSYTHAWINDNTLVIMSANGDADKVIWTKLNVDDMRILAEGTLDLPLPEGAKVFTTSGILTYSEGAGKLYYFYYGKNKTGRGAVATSNFLSAVINPSDMTIESSKVNLLASEMAGSAYGELMQNCVMYDESGNLYLAAFTDANEIEQGHLLRIKKGETDFDASYEGYPNADGKLLTIQSLGNGKALTYARNDATGTDIDSYSHYYSIVNLNTGARERLKYNGQEIPYSSGRFSQRTVVVDGKAYVGVNTADSNPCIYIYDIETGNIEKGVEIAEGYYFDNLRVLKNDE
ncbi:MAG: hypothetical protein PHG27_02450 [Massilibacteroides sp.]|nr:hypothetical protein [Massilibacteroides sp.]MDD3062512.1 hypothetical protein [Massilibacteroides sp.]MDD4114447.1 hypothetical protein [Massilibacteroides sp.]MDD4660342.1 hypothetical protein [Massilibacteroides sp.]